MKFPMPREYKHIHPVDNVWYGEPHYKKALLVPEINIKYGSVLSKMKTTAWVHSLYKRMYFLQGKLSKD